MGGVRRMLESGDSAPPPIFIPTSWALCTCQPSLPPKAVALGSSQHLAQNTVKDKVQSLYLCTVHLPKLNLLLSSCGKARCRLKLVLLGLFLPPCFALYSPSPQLESHHFSICLHSKLNKSTSPSRGKTHLLKEIFSSICDSVVPQGRVR